MNRTSSVFLAGVVATGLLACQKEDPATKEKLDKIVAKLESLEKKIDSMPAGRPGAMQPGQGGPRPGSPDPAATYSVPVDATNPAKGPATALVTIVEAAEFA